MSVLTTGTLNYGQVQLITGPLSTRSRMRVSWKLSSGGRRLRVTIKSSADEYPAINPRAGLPAAANLFSPLECLAVFCFVESRVSFLLAHVLSEREGPVSGAVTRRPLECKERTRHSALQSPLTLKSWRRTFLPRNTDDPGRCWNFQNYLRRPRLLARQFCHQVVGRSLRRFACVVSFSLFCLFIVCFYFRFL